MQFQDLTYPYTYKIFLSNSWPNAFDQLRYNHHFGLDDLMNREDLWDVVLEQYIQIYPTVYAQNDPLIDKETFNNVYNMSTKDFFNKQCLELLFV